MNSTNAAQNRKSNVPMTRPEEALAIHNQHYGHSVTFVGLSGGRILMCGGEFSVSSDGGITWSKPFKGQDKAGEPLAYGAGSLVNLSGGAIGLVHSSSKARVSRYEAESVFRASEDEGKTWSDPVVMNQGYIRASTCQNTFLRTESGRIILPAAFAIGQGTEPAPWHHEGAPFVGGYLNGNFVSTDAHFFDPHFGASYILYSDDDGKTWNRNKDGELFVTLGFEEPRYSAAEPSVVEISAGKLLMIVRTGLGRLFQAWSEDNGETWSRLAPTQLAASRAPGQIHKFPKTGHLLCVWTQQSEKEIKQGFIRTRLSSAISRNGGGIWEHFQNIESIHEETHVEPGPVRLIRPEGQVLGHLAPALENDADYVMPLPEGYGRWSYPSVFVAEDRVLISHTYSVHDSKTSETAPRNGSKLKVLPHSWFYGGQEPFESPLAKKISEAPRP